jgi:dienelactone hydrolase
LEIPLNSFISSNFPPESCHAPLLDAAPRALAFEKWKNGNLAEWRQRLDAAFRGVLGKTPEPVPLAIRREWEEKRDGFREIRFVFAAEAGADVPCHLLLPRRGDAPFPVVICLQGHTTGMHISLGRAQSEADEEAVRGGRDFGLQAVREGYAALVMEQRCFGERKDRRPPEHQGLKNRCHHASMVALLLGRTMVGERAWDVARAIDALETFPEIDATRIGCMGNSGGGTITFYAACVEPRIKVAMPSCSVCTMKDSSGSIDHCADNYLPGMLLHFDMGDLAGLIAPRPLIVVAGKDDPIFPIAGVRRNFETIQAIYAANGAASQCRLIVGGEGHRFYPEESWPVFRELSGW